MLFTYKVFLTAILKVYDKQIKVWIILILLLDFFLGLAEVDFFLRCIFLRGLRGGEGGTYSEPESSQEVVVVEKA